MSLNIPDAYVRDAQQKRPDSLMAGLPTSYGDITTIPSAAMTPAMLTEVREIAEAWSDEDNLPERFAARGYASDRKRIAKESASLVRVIDAILMARAGKFDKSIPSLKASPEIVLAFLRQNLKRGWLFKRERDDHLHAYLVTGVKVVEPSMRDRDEKPYLQISAVSNNPARAGKKGRALSHTTFDFQGEDVTRKKVSDVLLNDGLYIETPALIAEYEEDLAHFTEVLTRGFAEQYLFTGQPQDAENYRDDTSERSGAKVIHDVHRSEIGTSSDYAYSDLFADPSKDDSRARRKDGEASADEEGVGQIPTRFSLRVFDLATHTFLWVNVTDLTRYVYDPTLGTKLVLPQDQRDLLDILTTDLDAFVGDVIAGKSSGNVVLCKGKPGVGKTLTAEVYGEMIQRPLYSIHSGTLGISADDVRQNLETVFKRAKRWHCVLLLDEADVFVLERGGNISQNAIVAEFLRTMEYFDGLLFMTTNRADNIDDAILSRAAAIIDYDIPSKEAVREIWTVQATNNGVVLEEDFLDDMVDGFAHITGRDVKMLLRLALRVAKGKDVPLSTDIVAQCSIFRGLHFAKGSRD